MNDWSIVTPGELSTAVISASRAYDPRIETVPPQVGDVVFIRSISPLHRKTRVAKVRFVEAGVVGVHWYRHDRMNEGQAALHHVIVESRMAFDAGWQLYWKPRKK